MSETLLLIALERAVQTRELIARMHSPRTQTMVWGSRAGSEVEGVNEGGTSVQLSAIKDGLTKQNRKGPSGSHLCVGAEWERNFWLGYSGS